MAKPEFEVGDRCRWLALEPGVADRRENYPIATITSIGVEDNGDHSVSLMFDDDHKDVRVELGEIIPV